MTTLAIAAQKHHKETNPLMVSHINNGVTTRFTTPSPESARWLDASSAPHTAIT